MTGRRLYELVTDAVFSEQAYAPHGDSWQGRQSGVVVGNFVGRAPVVWAFLPKYERDAWNAAARRVTKGKRS